MKVLILRGLGLFKATDGSAAYDLPWSPERHEDKFFLAPGERKLCPTGVVIQPPPGYAALVLPRSGLAAKRGLTVVNTPGLIDPDYRGEIQVALLNTSRSAIDHTVIEPGSRIAQLMLVPYIVPEVEVVETLLALNVTSRGTGGFGSTGV